MGVSARFIFKCIGNCNGIVKVKIEHRERIRTTMNSKYFVFSAIAVISYTEAKLTTLEGEYYQLKLNKS